MTTATIVPEKGADHAVVADHWDSAEYADTRDKMLPLQQAERELKDVNWTGDRLVRDLWQLAYQPLPKLQDPVDPAFAVNAAVARETKESDALADARPHTVNNPGASALYAASMRHHLRNVYKRLAEVQEKADEAQRKLDEAREAQDQQAAGGASGAGQPGEDGSPAPGAGGLSDEQIQALLDAADRARAELDEALDQEVPAIGKAVREATAAAAAEANDNAEKLAAWGLDRGRAAEVDPSEYSELLKDASDFRIRKLAELIGAMRNDVRGLRERDTERVPTEVYDVTLGDNLDRLLPCELASLALPELQVDFYRRFAEKELLVYRMRGRERAARGPVIYIEDSSISMFQNGGLRHQWARSLGGALLSIAVDDRRGFEAIVFGGPGQTQSFRFDEPADYTPRKQLDYMKFCFEGAGTDFCTPLDVALEYMEHEFATKGRVESDVVFATDGECEVPDEWLATFKAAQQQLKFRVFGLAVAMPTFKALDDICDGRVVRVDQLNDASDVREFMQALAR